MSNQQRRRRSLRLADNPLDLEDELEPMVAEPEELFEEPEYEDEELEGGVYRARKAVARKGKSVSGPRTKLAADRVSRMERAIVDLADTQTGLARSVAALAKAVVRNDGDMDEEYEDDGEQMDYARKARKSGARKSRNIRRGDAESSFQPYGDEKDQGDPESQDPEETTRNEAGLQDWQGTKEVTGKARKSRKARKSLRKDDASGNYGEKDNDIPGNREAGIDDKDKPAEEYLIQGDEGDGPGPVSKAVMDEVNSAVSAVLAKNGISNVRKSRSPGIGGSSVETGKPVDMEQLFVQAKDMSFSQLNRLRTEAGLIARGVL